MVELGDVRVAYKVYRMKRLAALMHRFQLSAWWGKSPVGMRLGVHDPRALTDFSIDEYSKINHMGPDKFEQFRLFTLAGHCRYTMEEEKPELVAKYIREFMSEE
jgi:hypothetical protein